VKLIEDLLISAGLVALGAAILKGGRPKQIPAPPLDDDMLTEDAIMRRLDGNTLVPERPFDDKFWNGGMGWK
jgi:hypothetical protein